MTTGQAMLGREAELVRGVYPRHAMKLLARLMEVPLDTARHWLYRRFSAQRTRELALKLLTELDEQDRRRAELRCKLKAIAHDGDRGEASDLLAGEDPGGPRLPETGPPGGATGGAMTPIKTVRKEPTGAQ